VVPLDSEAQETEPREKLEVKIDHITFRVSRRQFKKSKRWGFYLRTGGEVHGRRSWIQILVMETNDTPEERARKLEKNRARKKLVKEQERVAQSISASVEHDRRQKPK
jgi:hypothetical protein